LGPLTVTERLRERDWASALSAVTATPARARTAADAAIVTRRDRLAETGWWEVIISAL